MNKEILYIMIPKTGTTTIIKHFEHYFDIIKKHATINYLQLEGGVNLSDYKYILASVRNPWERNWSLYNWHSIVHKSFSNLTFSEWLRNPVVKVNEVNQYIDSLNNNPLQQKNYLIDKNGKIRYDYIIRLDNIDEDITNCKFINEGISYADSYSDDFGILSDTEGGLVFIHEPQKNITIMDWNNQKFYNSKEYRKYYTIEDADYVTKLSEWEIGEFNYEF